jgi:PAS domain S-box-containing protein
MPGDEDSDDEQRARDRYEAVILRGLGDAVISFDTAQRITSWNDAAERLWGYTRAEMLGKRSDEVIVIEGPERAKLREALLRGESVTTGARVRRKDGSWLEGEGTTLPVCDADGKVIAYASIMRDVGERVRLTRELESAYRELDGFTYSVSHDLRAPLRAIDGFSRLLLEEHATALDGEASRLLGVIRRNTQRMGRLIDDLLGFSRLGRKQLLRARVDMTALARTAAEEMTQEQPGRSIELSIAELPAAIGDSGLLRQVWVNLLGNAVKYTSPREVARIDVSGSESNGERCYVVSDNGVGFDMEYVSKLFQVFQRLHTASEFEGTGVGLALVQRIVERHGGRVWAEGRPGQGAKFGFALPRKEDES